MRNEEERILKLFSERVDYEGHKERERILSDYLKKIIQLGSTVLDSPTTQENPEIVKTTKNTLNRVNNLGVASRRQIQSQKQLTDAIEGIQESIVDLKDQAKKVPELREKLDEFVKQVNELSEEVSEKRTPEVARFIAETLTKDVKALDKKIMSLELFRTQIKTVIGIILFFSAIVAIIGFLIQINVI